MHATMIRRVSVHVWKNIANQHTPCSSTLGELGPASHRPGTWDATTDHYSHLSSQRRPSTVRPAVWELLPNSMSHHRWPALRATHRPWMAMVQWHARLWPHGEDHRDPVRRARLLPYRKLREAVALCTKRAKSCSDGGGKHPPKRFEHPQQLGLRISSPSSIEVVSKIFYQHLCQPTTANKNQPLS